MSVKHIEIFTTAGSDLNSEAWFVQDVGNGSLHLVWSGLDSDDATAEMQASNDEINWVRSGCANSAIILDTASDSQIWEFRGFTTRYVRLKYVANTVTAGTLTIRTFGQPLVGLNR